MESVANVTGADDVTMEEDSPMCPGRGECGRGRVGDVLVRIRLFLLLVRQLKNKQTHNYDTSLGEYR